MSLDNWIKSNSVIDFEFDDYDTMNVARVYATQRRSEFDEFISSEVETTDSTMDFAQFVQEQAAEEVAEKSVTSSLRYVTQKYGMRRLGYAIPYIGYAFLAYDIYQFGKYVSER